MKSPADFPLPCISKSELAMQYCQTDDPHQACRTLRRWIRRSPGLYEALLSTGYSPRQHLLTPAQLQLICSALGEP